MTPLSGLTTVVSALPGAEEGWEGGNEGGGREKQKRAPCS